MTATGTDEDAKCDINRATEFLGVFVLEGMEMAVGVDVTEAEGGGMPLYKARITSAACSARPYVGAWSCIQKYSK